MAALNFKILKGTVQRCSTFPSASMQKTPSKSPMKRHFSCGPMPGSNMKNYSKHNIFEKYKHYYIVMAIWCPI